MILEHETKELFDKAIEVFGSVRIAKSWMLSPNAHFQNERPINVDCNAVLDMLEFIDQSSLISLRQ